MPARRVCLDIKRPEGRDIVLDLAGRADVFMENFRPRARHDALLNNYQTAGTSRTGESPEPAGDISAPMLGRFKAKEGYVMLAGYLPRHCQSIAKAIGLNQWADITFKDLVQDGPEIQQAVSARLLEKTAMEWDTIFDQLGVVAGGVRELTEVFQTGQPEARELTTPLKTAAGDLHFTTNGYRVNDRVWGPKFGVSRLGEDSREVLQSLGLADERIEDLIEQGIVKQAKDAS